jgi:hypothetical protein
METSKAQRMLISFSEYFIELTEELEEVKEELRLIKAKSPNL